MYMLTEEIRDQLLFSFLKDFTFHSQNRKNGWEGKQALVDNEVFSTHFRNSHINTFSSLT